MKRSMVLLFRVLAILAFTGSSLGNDDVNESLQRRCPITQDEGETMNEKIFELGRMCLDTTGGDGNLVLFYKTLDEQKDFFKSYSGKQPQIRECLADVARMSQSCQNETRHQSFQVFRELLETSVEAGCVENGEVLANLIMIYKYNDTTETTTNYFHNCLSIHVQKISNSRGLGITDFSRYYMIYRDIGLAKDCFNGISDGDLHIKDSIVSFLNVIVGKSKCFDPQDDSVVLCTSIDRKYNECPYKSPGEQTEPLYNVFLDQVIHSISTIDQGEYQGVDTFATRELTVNYLEKICAKKHTIKNMLTDVTTLASTCLNRAEHVMVQTVVDFMKNLLDNMCMENGQHLANVMFKVFSDVANTTQENALKECLIVAQPPNEPITRYFTSEMTLKYYQKLKVFKGCLLNKLQGDDVAVASAEIILNGVINNMWCPILEQTALIHCETIANTSSFENFFGIGT